MDYHTAKTTEFAYTPEYHTCNLTFYSDVLNRHTNGLLVVRIHSDPQSMKLRSSISSNNLSTYYLPDLINLLNMDENGYKEITKRHKKVTSDFNFIDYEELQQTYECVNDLGKMTNRLQILGTSAQSILNDYRKLYAAVCVEGHVQSPDSVFVSRSNFFDSKIYSADAVAEYLVTNSRQHLTTSTAKTHRYGLSGSAIYVLVYKNNNVFNYIVYLSEEPISLLVQALVDQAEFVTGFDFIYTVAGRTICDSESCPYIETPDGVYFKDVVLYSNENRFSMPMLSLFNSFKMLLTEDSDSENSRSDKESPGYSHTYRALPLLSSLFGDQTMDYNSVDEQLFDILNNHFDQTELVDQLLDIDLGTSSLYQVSAHDIARHPLVYAFDIGNKFIQNHIKNLDSGLLRIFLRKWYDLTNYEKIKDLENTIGYNSLHRSQSTFKLPRSKSGFNLSRATSVDDFHSLYSLSDESEFGSNGMF